MRLVILILMFASSYSPLWTILYWRRMGIDHATVGLGAAILATAALALWVLRAVAAARNHVTLNVYTVTERSSDAMNYLIPYLLAVPFFDLTDQADIATLGILLLITFAVYATSNLLYYNPLVHLVGLRIFHLRFADGRDAVLISREPLKTGEPARLKPVSRGIYWR